MPWRQPLAANVLENSDLVLPAAQDECPSCPGFVGSCIRQESHIDARSGSWRGMPLNCSVAFVLETRAHSSYGIMGSFKNQHHLSRIKIRCIPQLHQQRHFSDVLGKSTDMTEELLFLLMRKNDAHMIPQW